MDSDLDTNALQTSTGNDIVPDSPEARWTAWAIWSGISLVMVLLAVFGAHFDTGLLLGWAVGIIVSATLMVFGR